MNQEVFVDFYVTSLGLEFQSRAEMKDLSCKAVLILLSSLLSGNILENTITGNMEKDMCCCYRKTEFISKDFLETCRKHGSNKETLASGMYVRKLCTLECLPPNF